MLPLQMRPLYPTVGLYSKYGIRETSVTFKRAWHAQLFHLLLNKSISHQGTRDY